MNDKKYFAWQAAGFGFAVAFGSALHFIYEWTGKARWAAFIGAVNESTWEHTKLLIVAMVIFAVIEYFAYGKAVQCFLPAKFFSIVLGAVMIISAFYTYTGVFGRGYTAVDITIFILSALSSYYFAWRQLIREDICTVTARVLSAAGIVALIVAVVVFTLSPPHIPLFRDPITATYGVFRE